jgi:pimeloyl-ACP methyl ester carboxylesterase
MKSSSKLFPVALMKADVVAERFIEDTYLLKPNNSPDKTVQVAITRLGYSDKPEEHKGQPVILIHGSFTNRGFWLSSSGKGLASALLDQGFDPWMLEMRGHGDSPVNQNYSANNVEQYAEYDIPAAADFVIEQTKQSPLWVGHSLGGVIISTSLAGGHLAEEKVAGLALFGSQVSKYPLILRLPGFRLIAQTVLSLKRSNIVNPKGPEQEPKGIAKEFVRWAGILTGWKPSKGPSYWKVIPDNNISLIAFGAPKDKGDPAKHCKRLAESINKNCEYHLLNKKSGYKQDYGHVNMIVSKEAEQEVWPKLINWFKTLNRKEGINNDTVCDS